MKVKVISWWVFTCYISASWLLPLGIIGEHSYWAAVIIIHAFTGWVFIILLLSLISAHKVEKIAKGDL